MRGIIAGARIIACARKHVTRTRDMWRQLDVKQLFISITRS